MNEQELNELSNKQLISVINEVTNERDSLIKLITDSNEDILTKEDEIYWLGSEINDLEDNIRTSEIELESVNTELTQLENKLLERERNGVVKYTAAELEEAGQRRLFS